jgi:hypothetical protein
MVGEGAFGPQLPVAKPVLTCQGRPQDTISAFRTVGPRLEQQYPLAQGALAVRDLRSDRRISPDCVRRELDDVRQRSPSGRVHKLEISK